MEFLVFLDAELNAVPPERLAELAGREREVAAELSRAGALRRMWRAPGRTASFSIWEAADATVLHELLSQLPLLPWMQASVTPLAAHPADPGPG